MKKLSREEMKSIKGSENEPGTCTATCNDKTTITCTGSNCYAQDANSDSDGKCGSPGGGEKYCGSL